MSKFKFDNLTVTVNDETDKKFGEKKVVKANVYLDSDQKEMDITIVKPETKDTSKNPPIHNGICTVRVLKNDDFRLTLVVKHGDNIGAELDAIKLDLAKAVDVINTYNS